MTRSSRKANHSKKVRHNLLIPRITLTVCTEKTVYKYTEERDGKSEKVEEEEDEEVVTKKTTVIEGLPPPPASIRGGSPTRTEKSHRSHHTRHHSHAPSEKDVEIEAERVEISNDIGGPLTVLAPQNRLKHDAEVHREIRALEAERRALRSERESDYELVERVDRWDDGPRRERARSKSVVRVEKDRKGRLALVRSTH